MSAFDSVTIEAHVSAINVGCIAIGSRDRNPTLKSVHMYSAKSNSSAQSNMLVRVYALNVSFLFGVSSEKNGVKCRPVNPSRFDKRGVIQNSTLNAFASLARDCASNATSAVVTFDGIDVT